MCVAGLGELERVIVRACAGISDKGIQGSIHTVYTHIRPILFDITDALENLALYTCVGGHHMLHKFATISLFLLSSSYHVLNGLWVLLVFVGAHTPDALLLFLHEILVLICQHPTVACKTCY